MTDRQTDQIGNRLKTISTDVKLYIEKRIELLLLNIGERLSQWAAESVHKLIGISLLVLGAIFTLTTLAIFLSDILNNPTLGFLIVSVFLLLLGGMSYYLKPHRFSDYLQHQFESEVLKVLSLNGEKQKKKSEELPESAEQVKK